MGREERLRGNVGKVLGELFPRGRVLGEWECDGRQGSCKQAAIGLRGALKINNLRDGGKDSEHNLPELQSSVDTGVPSKKDSWE